MVPESRETTPVVPEVKERLEAAAVVRLIAPEPVIFPTEVRFPVTFALPSKDWPHRVLEVVNVAAEPSILVMPVSACAAEVRFKAIAVVPT